MNEKKIEPTDAMVEAGASYAWEEANPGALGWNSISELHKEGFRGARAVLAAALNHPDAAGLFADSDARPWEPLNEHDPLHVGDEVRQDHGGITATAVVGSVDGGGNPWSANDSFIGWLEAGTWYVRRAAQELPTERDGVVLVAADGHESITTTDGQEFSRLTYSKELSKWYGPNLAQLGECVIQTTSLSRLIPGTWKVGDQ